MRHWHLAGSTALILGLSQAPALAVTPEEVWANWQQAMASAGLTVAGSAVREGDTLQAGAVTVTIPDPEGGSGSAKVSFEGLAFRDRGDGTVEVTLPARYVFAGQGMDGPGSFVATLEETGLSMVASGTAEATGYALAAERYALTFGEFTEEDGVTPVDLTAKVTVAGMAAAYAVTPGAGTTAIDSTASAASTTFELAGTNASSGGTVSFTASLGEISTTTKGVFVGPELMENMSAALAAGFFVDSTTTVGPVSVKGDFSERGDTARIDAVLTGAKARLALDAARIDYGFGLTGADITVAGSEMPLPEIRTAFGELSFNVLLPVAMSETPQAWSAVARLVDLTAADSLWSMFDPGGQLKRDPVTLIVDVKGTGRWTADILDPAVQAQAVPPQSCCRWMCRRSVQGAGRRGGRDRGLHLRQQRPCHLRRPARTHRQADHQTDGHQCADRHGGVDGLHPRGRGDCRAHGVGAAGQAGGGAGSAGVGDRVQGQGPVRERAADALAARVLAARVLAQGAPADYLNHRL